MRGYNKQKLAYNRIELYLAMTYYFITKNLGGIAHKWSIIHSYQNRALKLEFEGLETLTNQILEALKAGIEYFQKLCGVDVSVNLKINNNIATLQATLQDRPDLADNPPSDLHGGRYRRLRYELVKTDPKLNDFLTGKGVGRNIKQIYLNYARDCYRLSKIYKRSDLRNKMEELRLKEPYNKLDKGILISIQHIICPQAFDV